MRVISGTSRGRQLATIKGDKTRPTPDRVKEALFNILQSHCGGFSGLRVLDLFAGSGALAIEALSRGAASACLVDQSPAAIQKIRENLSRCRLTEHAIVINKGAFQSLREMQIESYDLVFIDPPYGKNLAERAINDICRYRLLSRQAILCAETGFNEELPERINTLRIFDQRRYGSVKLHFYSIIEESMK